MTPWSSLANVRVNRDLSHVYLPRLNVTSIIAPVQEGTETGETTRGYPWSLTNLDPSSEVEMVAKMEWGTKSTLRTTVWNWWYNSIPPSYGSVIS